MKKIFVIASGILLFSCSKKESEFSQTKSDSAKIIESINVVRTKINDSIRLKNDKNIYADLSGTHSLKFTSEGVSMSSGKVIFEKTGRDLYQISGTAQSGKNTLSIEGNIKRVSEKHLNFEGKIVQNINGNIFTRTKKTTFFDEGKGDFWRLQDKINGSGFVDYIDIYF
ncbi:MAG: hypothetical protein ACXWVV_02660 [Kaistella sp.]